jgi:hypothetical protein
MKTPMKKANKLVDEEARYVQGKWWCFARPDQMPRIALRLNNP